MKRCVQRCPALPFLIFTLLLLNSVAAGATPAFVEHIITKQVYGEAAGVTERSPVAPRETDSVTLWTRIGYSFYYTDVAIYYTTDGTTPAGSRGIGTGTTQVLRSSNGGVQFVRNEPASPANIDWWKAALPAATKTYGANISYMIGAWYSGTNAGPEVFATQSDGKTTTFTYTVNIAWPGSGSPNTNYAAGYPNVHFWKEEAVVGNGYLNAQIDQNGSLYDLYFPSAGCVQGMGTRNEGYIDGLDTFPASLTAGQRGQMNINEGMAGIQIAGKTYWQSNENGSDWTGITQSYVGDTNVVATSGNLTAGGANIHVDQYDFAPIGVTYPTDSGGTQPVRSLYIKRYLLTNNQAQTQNVNFYYYCNFALNGGGIFEGMFADPGTGAMVAYDNTQRLTSVSGEYNPTTFSDYTKNISVYLGAALKLCDSVGSATGNPATDSWADSSSDQTQGWIGLKVSLPPGQTREIDLQFVGGYDTFARATDTYSYQMIPSLLWFLNTSMNDLQTQTQAYWQNWLAQGMVVTTPDARYNTLFKRGLLGTALHLDGKNGGVVAGMHNGAYPFVWPRDAVYAAITLDRTGHNTEAANVYKFLNNTAFRGNESWGKGFFYQKYSTDGYQVWANPQVDETAAVPWGVAYHYNATGDSTFLNNNYTMVHDAAYASSSSSALDSRMYYDDANQLMRSMNVWEDSFDDFLYSNAGVERGVRDAAKLASLTGHSSDANVFSSRAGSIHQGLIARAQWDGENTDISQLGLTYPFAMFAPNDPLVTHLADRMNGAATDRNGANHPILNTSGEMNGLVNRYYGDTYWNGGPWFLSTAWYGLYYATKQNVEAGKSDIDLHKSKMDLLINRLGPVGFGAEQISPLNSLLYPGQTDFALQAAWPNAWESMSTFVDAITIFLDPTFNASGNALTIAPKLPTAWPSVTFSNVKIGSRSVNVALSETAGAVVHTITNVSGGTLAVTDAVRFPSAWTNPLVTINGLPASYTFDATANRAVITVNLASASSSQTVIQVVPGVTVSGTITLDSVVAKAVAAQPVTFQFRPTTGASFTRTLNLNSDGTYTLTGISPGMYQVAIKGSKWLQVTQALDATNGNVSGFSATLPGGDANNDNRVDVLDFGVLVNAYGSAASDPNSGYDLTADFNGDGLVDVLDFGILVNNYGTMGDM